MQKKESSSIVVNSDSNLPRARRPFLINQEKKIALTQNFLINSDDDIINNTNNDIFDEDDIDEENIFEKTIGDKILHTPINDTHRLFLSKNKFGKTFINSKPLKKILVPKSKYPNIKNDGRNKNDSQKTNDNNTNKNLTTKDELIDLNNDFLHCRNCILVVALNRYGKYYFNK
jgi:hypothetical protein